MMTISPKEFAEAITASESSIKRWVDDGRIRAQKTSGGHRRITREEAIRFIRHNRIDVVNGYVIGFPDVDVYSSIEKPSGNDVECLYALLKDGRAQEARGFLQTLFLQGHELPAIYDGPMKDAMSRLGELWVHDKDGICVEHVATDICIQAVNQFRMLFENNHEGPLAYGGAAPGDPYILPSLMAVSVLGAEGLRAVNLGPDSPVDAYLRVIENQKPSLLWISVSVTQRGVMGEIARIAEAAHEAGVLVLMGGAAIDALKKASLPGVQFGSSMAELAAFARGMLMRSDSREAMSA